MDATTHNMTQPHARKDGHMTKKRDVLPPDHPAYTDAVAAMRRYHEALEEGACAEEVERLRLVAESLFQAVTDYQLGALGGPSATFH